MKTKILLLFICIATGLMSCNDWLDVELEDKVDESKLYSSAEGFRESLAGIYSSMADSLMYGSAMTLEYIDLIGQYYIHSTINGMDNTYKYFLAFDYENAGVKSVISAFWNRMYKCIAQANSILEWADKNSHVLTDAERNRIKGEATALRAFLHFDLYRMFSADAKRSPKANAIPYNKKFGVSLPPMYTAEEVVQLVIDDLKDAETLLADDPITTVIPYQMASKNDADQYVARMNLWTVRAMLARAYQARGDYNKAISTAKEVIASGKFRMLEFDDIDKGESQIDAIFSSEHIFSLRNKNIKRICQRLFRNNTSNGVTTLTPLPFVSYSDICEGNNDDARYATWFPDDFMKYFYENTGVFFRKMPMIKLSEMYLIIAECSYENDPATALSYLNMLRDRRIINNTHLQYISQETIMQEMRREYIGEGQIWYAFKRNNWTLPGNSGGIAPSDAIFVFPIPDSEIEDGHRN